MICNLESVRIGAASAEQVRLLVDQLVYNFNSVTQLIAERNPSQVVDRGNHKLLSLLHLLQVATSCNRWPLIAAGCVWIALGRC